MISGMLQNTNLLPNAYVCVCVCVCVCVYYFSKN